GAQGPQSADERAAGGARYRRHCLHPRHQHHRGDGLFHESHRPEREAGGDRGSAAAVQHVKLRRAAQLAEGHSGAPGPDPRGKGTLVVLNDEINAARDVSKTNTYRVETFQARELGILGYADPDKIVFYRAPTRKHTAQSEFDLAQATELPKVSILYGYAGDDG